MTACAISWLRALIRARISSATPAARVRTGVPPGRDGLLGRGQQPVDLGMRIRDAEIDAVGRPLARHLAVGPCLLQGERLAQVTVERRLAVCGGLAPRHALRRRTP